ncbi:MAG: TIGR04283 family arsenosugar biosynthesis glycosyltransferase [Methylicorpusculum sp.]|uniref:TIGR04283 family arsenosugar biosynthesis glycosyltransferase n=1 Tax=Methylicorpusculum sp. TaxID=2713644 RepID=UPI002724D6F1|nr:TIGR04283 family arsenosugar biosynthesis glycosyltransferase [Methylicorpusculum sp.]MDO8843915.1 TIGR04283 family arsenosugar biosynthesis glycosyltransferase [Methylicorpusculum sp.]MDO8940086.1 TIGR04283 family arsenosugar biosynthesis glycosyltransferase [Methylicorpusculum sp.]MDP2203376.1 TIGR04283 family arsenosugar biosynthesis glycosyltransferase [Methylicorpusculum sp.]
MFFSIVIPTLNEVDGILPVLMHLQGLRDQAEIIVVDGGSEDDTVPRASYWVDKVLISGRGRAVQMNAGALTATGDVLIFLHADTFLPDDALSSIRHSITEEYFWGRFDIDLIGDHFMLRIISFLMNWRSRLSGIATGDQVIFVARESFFQVGLFPEIALMEDIALSKALNKIGKPANLAGKVSSSARRWEQFGLLKVILLMWNLRLRYSFGEDPVVLAEMYRTGRFWKH